MTKSGAIVHWDIKGLTHLSLISKELTACLCFWLQWSNVYESPDARCIYLDGIRSRSGCIIGPDLRQRLYILRAPFSLSLAS
jgi:hypothetical protein